MLETVSEDSIIMPGLVDTHVHINEPGRTEWEGFATATRAAAAGGVTTLVDMPLNSIPPTTTAEGLRAKVAAAGDQCSVDLGFWAGVIPGNTGELSMLFAMGAVGFKCFLVHSGVDEFPNVTEENLREAMPELTRLGALLIVHAELPGPIEAACCAAHSEVASSRYETFLQARPRAAENDAVALMIKLGREFRTRVHIVHHSSADALYLLRDAKAADLNITAETCPHYLYFAAEEIPDGATEFKCCPPIRERENREQLWQALADGTIDMIVSDHSPCPPDMKCRDEGDFIKAWGGISSFRATPLDMKAEADLHFIESVNQLIGHGWPYSPPEAGEPGWRFYAAAAFNGHNPWFQVMPEMLHHRHRFTPYRDQLLQGVVQKTFLRGRKIYDGGEFFGVPSGRLLLKAGHYREP